MINNLKHILARLISDRVQSLEDQLEQYNLEVNRQRGEVICCERDIRVQASTIERLEQELLTRIDDYMDLKHRFDELLQQIRMMMTNEDSYQHLYEALREDYDALEDFYLAEGVLAIDHLEQRLDTYRRFLSEVKAHIECDLHAGITSYQNEELRRKAQELLDQENSYPPRQK